MTRHPFYVLSIHATVITAPFTSYIFTVLVNTTEGEGKVSVAQSFTTLQASPTSPLNINASILSYNSLLITWRPPQCSNGVLSGYMVSCTTMQCTGQYAINSTFWGYNFITINFLGYIYWNPTMFSFQILYHATFLYEKMLQIF